MKTEILTACDQTVAATANGLYQGVILTILVALCLRLLGRSTNAATRHSIWMATLLLLPGIIVAHYCLDNRKPAREPVDQGKQASVAPEIPQILPVLLLGNQKSEADLTVRNIPEPRRDSRPVHHSDLVWTQPQKQSVPVGPPVPWADFAEAEERVRPGVEHLSLLPPTRNASTTESASTIIGAQPARTLAARIQENLRLLLLKFSKPVSWNLVSGPRVPRVASLALLGAWLSIATLKILVLTWRLYELRMLKRNSAPADEILTELFQSLRARLGLRRKVSLRVSGVHRSPVVLGFLHPVVLLPPAEVLPSDSGETEHILRHELAHVCRRDDWSNLIQHFLQASLFFHPGVWWLSRRLALDREIACDDQVLQQVGRPRAYALILANLATRMKRCSPMLAPGASTNKSQLQQRINMILDTKRNNSPRLAKTRMGFVTSAAALLAVLAIYSGPRLVLAQTAPTPSADNQPKPEVAVEAVAGEVGADVVSAQPAGGSIVVVQADATPAPGPAENDAGPRFKPEEPGVPATPQAENVAPLTPVPPVAVIVSGPTPAPVIVGAPRAPMALPPGPRPPGIAYARAGADEGSIEQRLERLERMVHSLMGQQNGPKAFPGYAMPKHQEWNMKLDEKQMAEIKEMAEREAGRAEQEAKRAAEDMKRANKEMEKAMKDQGEWKRGPRKEASEKQLEALRRARENLEHQMEKLDSQIEKLEQDREKLQEEQNRRSELQEEQKAQDEEKAQEAAVAEVETE